MVLTQITLKSSTSLPSRNHTFRNNEANPTNENRRVSRDIGLKNVPPGPSRESKSHCQLVPDSCRINNVSHVSTVISKNEIR